LISILIDAEEGFFDSGGECARIANREIGLGKNFSLGRGIKVRKRVGWMGSSRGQFSRFPMIGDFSEKGRAEAALGGSFAGENGQAIEEVALHPLRKFWSGCGVGGDDFRKATSRPDLNATDFFAGVGSTELVRLA